MEAVTVNYEESSADERVDLAKSLLNSLEQGDEDGVKRAISELTRSQESFLFQEIGKLTRQLHDALGICHNDERIADIAKKDIPDARERLNYVITKTEESAHRTLDLVENLLPLSEDLQNRADGIRSDWQRFVRREMDVEEFRKLSAQIEEFLNQVCGNSSKIENDLSEVMLAQDYQDITGQVIRQVISLVQEVESRLVSVIRHVGTEKPVNEPNPIKDILAEGPQINEEDNPNVMSGQDEVDDLLSSLGF